jgi:dCMP deaminase
VIIYDKRVVGEGYNGAPPNNKSCLEIGQCYKERITGKKYEDTMNSGLCRGVHSERNAFYNMMISPPRDRTSSLYNTIFPCHTCSKDIIGTRLIGEIFFSEFYDLREFKQSVEQLNEAGIKLKHLRLSKERFDDIMYGGPEVKFDIWTPEEKKIF